MHAGIIGARPNNGLGIAGIAPNLRQMILKVQQGVRLDRGPSLSSFPDGSGYTRHAALLSVLVS